MSPKTYKISKNGYVSINYTVQRKLRIKINESAHLKIKRIMFKLNKMTVYKKNPFLFHVIQIISHLDL